MSDFSGPITGCFKIVFIIIVAITLIISFAVYKSDKIEEEQNEKEKKEIYQKGKIDAMKEATRKLDSIKNLKK